MVKHESVSKIVEEEHQAAGDLIAYKSVCRTAPSDIQLIGRAVAFVSTRQLI